MYPTPVPFDPARADLVYRRSLPHWRQRGAAYFVTFRLADSVPRNIIQRWLSEHRRWLEQNPPPHSAEKQQQRMAMFGRKLLKYLDTGYGSCLLAAAEPRAEVENAMRYFDGTRYLLGEYAIMPNHVHALVMPLGDAELTRIAASWTAHSAVRINRCAGRTGRVWQPEPFDHIVRHQAAYQRFAAYIRDNPTKLPADKATAGCGRLGWE